MTSAVSASLTMRQLLEAGAHFGHRTRYWSPKMEAFIFGSRNRIHIINLEQTLPLLKDACNFAGKLAANGGKILFVENYDLRLARAMQEYYGGRYDVNHPKMREIADQIAALEAAQRAEVWSRIEDRVPHSRVVPAFVDVEPQQLPLLRLAPAQWEILTRVDGQRDLLMLAESLGRVFKNVESVGAKAYPQAKRCTHTIFVADRKG